MTNQVRLLDAPHSKASEVLTRLTRSSQFTVELGDAICNGNEDRAVNAMRRELIPELRSVAADGGNGGPYRSAGGQALPPDHYLVPCSYAPTPSMTELKRDFKGGVSGIFDGRAWKKYSLRVRADERPGDRIMVVKHFGQEMESEDVIAWGLDNNLVPAMGHNEALDFRKANPKLQLEFPIVSLGSFTLGDDGDRYVAVLHADGDRPWLSDRWFDYGWYARCRFLFLSK